MTKIKIIFSKDAKLKEMGLAETFIYTSEETVSELEKFNCYARLMDFLDENRSKYVEVFKDDTPDLILDLRDEFNKYSEQGIKYTIPEYIKLTSKTLDNYGNHLP